MTPVTLTEEERGTLLALARSAIADRLKPPHDRPEVAHSAGLSIQSGAFVTLNKRGRLRGCIGRFTADTPITQTVEDMALAAAFEDPRFPPLQPDELKDVDLEISVLTPMRRITQVGDIEVGKHGIYMIRGFQRGVLLPQVATEQGWDRTTFLNHTCLKAGMESNCWRNPETEIYVFSAEIFGEKE